MGFIAAADQPDAAPATEPTPHKPPGKRADIYAGDVPLERCIAIVRFRPPFQDVLFTTLKVVGSLIVIGIPLAIIFGILSNIK